MTRQLLIYETVVPITSARHRTWSVKAGENYAFARNVNSVPLTAVEFERAAAEYAIVFSGTDEAVMPAVILGLQNDANMYLSDSGSWKTEYIPAFIRRYPFVFSADGDAKTFTLCIDEEFVGCNQEGRGERLFDADGERTQYLGGVLDFQREYQAHFQRTAAFCKKLRDFDLLEPMQVTFSRGSGEKTAIAGFMGISRERLKALSGEQLVELARTDELELAYLHLNSLRHFPAMMQRVADESEPPLEEPPAQGAADKQVNTADSARAPT